MATLTVRTLAELRPGDEITGIGQTPIGVHVVEVVEADRVKLAHDGPTDWYLYPAHASAGLTVERAEQANGG